MRHRAPTLIAALLNLSGPAAAAQTHLVGRSADGRPITVTRMGDPSGPRVLVVGCIHGDESAGTAVTRRLRAVRWRADLWIVDVLDPDGAARGVRQNGHGVDLNRNWAWRWRGGGRPWDVEYPGPRPFSEPETRIARNLILRIRPAVTIWYHQHMDLVWAWGPATAIGRRYAAAAGMRLTTRRGLDGTAPTWQHHRLPGSAAFVVELPAGRLTRAAVDRHVRAIGRAASRARPAGQP